MPAPATPHYDRIGRLYARFRRPDPRIAAAIRDALGDARRVVDVDAGTGSYEPDDRLVLAVEPSEVMIAQRHATTATTVRAVAEALPFPDQAFDAAMAVLTVHHWPNRTRGLAELRRVAPRRVIFTFDPLIHNRHWLLRDYVPQAAELEASRSPSIDELIERAGATEVRVVPIPHDCVDGFGWAYYRRPEMYLDPEARSCISMLAQLPPADIAGGMSRLGADLQSGRWHERNAELLALDSVDGGYRLLIADDR